MSLADALGDVVATVLMLMMGVLDGSENWGSGEQGCDDERCLHVDSVENKI